MNPSDAARLLLDTLPPAMRRLRRELDTLSRSSLTVAQLRILNRLRESDASNLELADWLGVSAPSTTRMVDALERRGYLNRATAAQDRRKVRLRLTAKGRSAVEAVRDRLQKRLSQKLRALPRGELEALVRGLGVLQKIPG